MTTSTPTPADLTHALRYIGGETKAHFMPDHNAVRELLARGLVEAHPAGVLVGTPADMAERFRLTDAGKLALGWTSYARIRVLQPGETPWQHRDIPGVFEGPYIADGADAGLDELARECGDPRMGHRAVQDYWLREVDGDQEIWIELAPRGEEG